MIFLLKEIKLCKLYGASLETMLEYIPTKQIKVPSIEVGPLVCTMWIVKA